MHAEFTAEEHAEEGVCVLLVAVESAVLRTTHGPFGSAVNAHHGCHSPTDLVFPQRRGEHSGHCCALLVLWLVLLLIKDLSTLVLATATCTLPASPADRAASQATALATLLAAAYKLDMSTIPDPSSSSSIAPFGLKERHPGCRQYRQTGSIAAQPVQPVQQGSALAAHSASPVQWIAWIVRAARELYSTLRLSPHGHEC